MEYEVINHGLMKDLKILVDEIVYRAPHMHRELEIMYIVSGSLEIMEKDFCCTVEEGSVAIMNPWSTHGFRALSDSSTALFVQTSCSFCSEYFPVIERIRFKDVDITGYFSKGRKKQLISEIITLSKNYFLKEDFFEFDCMISLNKIFSQIIKTVPWRILSEEEIRSGNGDKRIQRVISHIRENCDNKLLLSDIAEAEGVTPGYLSHFIKKQLGMTFQEYLSSMRFEKAKLLIERSNFPISQISAMCGFSDVKYLNNILIKQTGFTASEYRKTRKINMTHAPISKGDTIERLYTDKESTELLSNIFPDNKI